MKSDSKCFVFKEACDLMINWTTKGLWDILVNKFIFNENINTAVYIMLLQQIDICLRRSEKHLTSIDI